MLCERCSARVRPVFVSDVDGTLAKYHQSCFSFVRQYWGMSNGDVCMWDGYGDFEDHVGVTKAQWREAKLAYRQGGVKRTMPGYWDAIHFAQRLARMGDLWIVTNRPWQRLDNIDKDTQFWLDKNNIPYTGLLFGDDKYGDLVEQIDPARIVMVMEDLPEQYDRAKELGLPVYQVARHHNSHPTQERAPRVTIDTLDDAAGKLLQRWTIEHTGGQDGT